MALLWNPPVQRHRIRGFQGRSNRCATRAPRVTHTDTYSLGRAPLRGCTGLHLILYSIHSTTTDRRWVRSHSNTPPVRNRAPLTARSSCSRCVSAAAHHTAEQHYKTGMAKPQNHHWENCLHFVYAPTRCLSFFYAPNCINAPQNVNHKKMHPAVFYFSRAYTNGISLRIIIKDYITTQTLINETALNLPLSLFAIATQSRNLKQFYSDNFLLL